MHGVALYCYCWNLYMSGNEEREKKRIGWFCRRRRCFFLFLLCRMSFSMCENARHIHVGLQLSLVSQKKQQQQPTNSSSARSHRFFYLRTKAIRSMLTIKSIEIGWKLGKEIQTLEKLILTFCVFAYSVWQSSYCVNIEFRYIKY